MKQLTGRCRVSGPSRRWFPIVIWRPEDRTDLEKSGGRVLDSSGPEISPSSISSSARRSSTCKSSSSSKINSSTGSREAAISGSESSFTALRSRIKLFFEIIFHKITEIFLLFFISNVWMIFNVWKNVQVFEMKLINIIKTILIIKKLNKIKIMGSVWMQKRFN